MDALEVESSDEFNFNLQVSKYMTLSLWSINLKSKRMSALSTLNQWPVHLLFRTFSYHFFADHNKECEIPYCQSKSNIKNNPDEEIYYHLNNSIQSNNSSLTLEKL